MAYDLAEQLMYKSTIEPSISMNQTTLVTNFYTTFETQQNAVKINRWRDVNFAVAAGEQFDEARRWDRVLRLAYDNV